MIVVWLFYSLMFLFGPIDYLSTPSAYAWLLIAAHVLVFAVGAGVGGAGERRSTPAGPPTEAFRRRLNVLVVVFALVGLAGGGLILADRMLLSGIDYSAGLAHARAQREGAAAVGQSGTPSPFLFFGLLVFSFADIAFMLYLLNDRLLTTRTTLVAQLSIVSPALFSVVYGGRGAILQVFTLIVGASVVRLAAGLPALPRTPAIKVVLALFAVAALAYSSFVFAGRREEFGQTDLEAYLAGAAQEASYGARPVPALIELAQSGVVSDETVVTTFSTLYYFTHSFSVYARLVDAPYDIGPYYGQAQINWVATFVDRLLPSLSIVQVMADQMGEIDANGLFLGTWGTFTLDFGLYGGLIEALVLGWLSGWCFRAAVRERRPGPQVIACFVIAAIVTSPISAPFAYGNGFLIFLASLLGASLLGDSRGAPVRGDAWPP